MRRFFRRGLRAGGANADLRQAHQLMEQGDYAAAAQSFEDLAPTARASHRVPILYLKAGHARIMAGQAAQAVDDMKNGLKMLAERGRWGRFQRAGQRAVAALRQAGMKTEADAVLEFLKTNSLSGGFDPEAVSTVKRRPLLPTHCPSCGAAIEPDEIEWMDEATAECDFCGSPIRAQGQGKA